MLQKAGVVVDTSPMAEEGDDSGWLPKESPEKTFVHTLFGLQTQLPYFAGEMQRVAADRVPLS